MAPSGRDYEAERHQRKLENIAFGQRLRKQRLKAGLPREHVADGAKISYSTYQRYELGSQVPRPARLLQFVGSIGCPIASLFVDELVLAEVRVSDETLERVRREGAPAAAEVAARMASSLEALLLAEASRPPLDLRPGARPRKRRSRAEVLSGVAAAQAGRAAHKQRDAAAGEIT